MRMVAQNLIPHRDEMLFVHNISVLEAGQRATGEWRPAQNAWLASDPRSVRLLQFLPLEALAQLGACAVFALERYHGRTPFLTGFQNVAFARPYSIQATVDLSVEIISLGSQFGKAYGLATVDAKPVCEGEISFAVL